MKRALFILTVCLFCLTGCGGGIRDVRVTSCSLQEIAPVGLSSVEAKLNIGVHNPAKQFTLSAINGTVKLGDTPFLLVTTDDITVIGNTDTSYEVEILGTLSNKINPMVVFSLIRSMDFSRLKADVKAHITMSNGSGKDIEMNDLPLADIIGKI